MSFLDNIPSAFVTDLILASDGDVANAVATITLNSELDYVGTDENVPAGTVWTATVIDGILNVRLPSTYSSPSELFEVTQAAYTVVWSGDVSGTEVWDLRQNLYTPGQHFTRAEVLLGQGAF